MRQRMAAVPVPTPEILGGTVIASLLVLLLTDLASTRALGPVAAIGIAMAILAALTFLPAALMTIGRAVFWPFQPKARPASASIGRTSVWGRIASLVAKRPRAIWIGLAASSRPRGRIAVTPGRALAGASSMIVMKPTSTPGTSVIAFQVNRPGDNRGREIGRRSFSLASEIHRRTQGSCRRARHPRPGRSGHRERGDHPRRERARSEQRNLASLGAQAQGFRQSHTN